MEAEEASRFKKESRELRKGRAHLKPPPGLERPPLRSPPAASFDQYSSTLTEGDRHPTSNTHSPGSERSYPGPPPGDTSDLSRSTSPIGDGDPKATEESSEATSKTSSTYLSGDRLLDSARSLTCDRETEDLPILIAHSKIVDAKVLDIDEKVDDWLALEPEYSRLLQKAISLGSLNF